MNDEYLLNKCILLVDDEPELLTMVYSILMEYGFQKIRTAKSVKEALKEAETSRPELAILDVMLPDGNGFDLMEQLKKRAAILSFSLLPAAKRRISLKALV